MCVCVGPSGSSSQRNTAGHLHHRNNVPRHRTVCLWVSNINTYTTHGQKLQIYTQTHNYQTINYRLCIHILQWWNNEVSDLQTIGMSENKQYQSNSIDFLSLSLSLQLSRSYEMRLVTVTTQSNQEQVAISLQHVNWAMTSQCVKPPNATTASWTTFR